MNYEEELLGAIEATELRSLQWGYVDGIMSEAEVDRLAERVLAGRAAPTPGAVDLVESLLAQNLIFERSGADGIGYRSRFAESVRLLSQLRQLLPGRPWATAPRLVSDYRVDSGYRLFPRRDMDGSGVFSQLALDRAITSDQEALANALLADRGRTLRMSEFQNRVLAWACQSGKESMGCVVTAGTGSGKTLAFYLPVIVQIAPHLSPRPWTKCLAVYPRRELLKDQFTEAFRLFRRAAPLLEAQGRRRISAGAQFSLSPYAATEEALERAGWPRGAVGFTCPYLRCPSCGADMVWPYPAVSGAEQVLVCARGGDCGVTVGPEEVPLTRSAINRAAPDFVFTTTETLNGRLSDPDYARALGITDVPGESVRWALLDEVHTYSGSDGAQVAYAVRRWRHALGSPPRIVGLSATLRDARPFFADLTGLPESTVTDIGPLESELEPLGAQYQLVLRGDPASRSSLLSTSIQTALLLPRLLDPIADSHRASGLFGSRVFVFTDDLDVTNRLFDDLRDAEAYDLFGRPDGSRQPLAALRASSAADAGPRATAGQRWDASEQIGHVLSRRLGVSRTTSKDGGVSPSTEVVVATSTLEVGFNDTTIGGVVQHKSPRSPAAFVQRKGRAGRTTRMRPWMVTVLSDYGHDRVTFQRYEQLFDPSLPAQRLPLRNRHVLAIQAAFSLIDWLARIAPRSLQTGWWWWPLNGPTDDGRRRKQQGWVEETIGSLVSGDRVLLDGLRSHLKGALGLEEEELDAVLWRQPRPLILALAPTLKRRLATGWNAAGPGGEPETDFYSHGLTPHPIPDFVPSTLFTDLNLPEVILEIPPPTRNDVASTETMPIAQALTVMAPGHVTRRFAHARGGLNHWVPVPLDSQTYVMPISEFAEEAEPFGDAPSTVVPGERIDCYRPWRIRLQQAPPNVLPSSHASFAWQSTLTAGTSPVELPVPGRGTWKDAIRSVQFFLHSQHTSVNVRRFAETADARIRLRREVDERRIKLTFVTASGNRAAVGFEHDVDGLRFTVPLPSDDRALGLGRDPLLRRVLLRGYFADTVQADSLLSAVANRFQLDWLQQIYLAAVMSVVTAENVITEQAVNRLAVAGLLDPSRVVMADMFRFIAVDPDATDQASPLADPSTDRLAATLEDILQMPGVPERLTALARNLHDPAPMAFAEWIRRRLAAAIGEVVAVACGSLAPGRSAAEDLLLDIVFPSSAGGEPHCEIWITEHAAGGTGTLQAVAMAYASDPSSFSRAMDAAAAPSDLEVVSGSLDKVLELLVTDPDAATAARSVRAEDHHSERSKAQRALFALLTRQGVAVDKTLSNALNQRLLRRGATETFDDLLMELRTHWSTVEQRAGVAIDLRTYCFLAASEPALHHRLDKLVHGVTGHSPSIGEIVGVLSGILWPLAWEARSSRDGYRSRYEDLGWTDPALVRVFTQRSTPAIDFGGPAWRAECLEILARSGEVTVVAQANQQDHLQGALLELLATPVDVGYLQFFPSVDAVARSTATTAVQLVLREIA